MAILFLVWSMPGPWTHTVSRWVSANSFAARPFFSYHIQAAWLPTTALGDRKGISHSRSATKRPGV